MRILWLNHRDPKHPDAGGAEIHLREVCRRLVERGCQVTLLSERFRGSRRTEVIEGIRVMRVGNKYGIHFEAPLFVSRLARQFDVVVDDIAHAVPWWSSLATRRPVVGIIHHVHQRVASVELKFPLDLLVKTAERTIKFTYKRIIADSEATKGQIETVLGLPGYKVEVVYCGVDHDFYRPSDEKYEDPTILWVGKLKKYKNVDHLLKAFKLAKTEVPDLRLVIDGDGYYKAEIVRLAERLGLKDVSFVDPVDGEEKVQLFGKSWALCLTSMIEGWGLVTVEAAACGTPTIAYNSGPAGEAVIDSQTGFLVDYGDVRALAEKIVLLVSNIKIRDALSRGAIEHSQKFDWGNTTDATLRILQEAASDYSL